MENLVNIQPFGNVFQGRRVLITGHTGFKGAWLSQWLLSMGAEPIGYALSPTTAPSMFNQLNLSRRMESHIADIRDQKKLSDVVTRTDATVVFHLAAQALVPLSFHNPRETFEANVIGTVNVLQAVRAAERPMTVIIVTSDKCYQNREWEYGYRENDPIGGADPYSASKGCAELVTASFRNSYFSAADCNVHVASVRAGNVIGGGDWAEGRIVPDIVRAFMANRPVKLRNPSSVRPWQHVLDCLSGYLSLVAAIDSASANHKSDQLFSLCTSFNFGPDTESTCTVREVVRRFQKYLPGSYEASDASDGWKESRLLRLVTDRAFRRLGWRPTLSLDESVKLTVDWYSRVKNSTDASFVQSVTDSQIEAFMKKAHTRVLHWTTSEN
jgi:CDP-glucose 4,6-dehydratase